MVVALLNDIHCYIAPLCTSECILLEREIVTLRVIEEKGERKENEQVTVTISDIENVLEEGSERLKLGGIAWSRR